MRKRHVVANAAAILVPVTAARALHHHHQHHPELCVYVWTCLELTAFCSGLRAECNVRIVNNFVTAHKMLLSWDAGTNIVTRRVLICMTHYCGEVRKFVINIYFHMFIVEYCMHILKRKESYTVKMSTIFWEEWMLQFRLFWQLEYSFISILYKMYFCSQYTSVQYCQVKI